MPLTFPAHQAIVLPLKLRWPRRFDATALCIGAAAPDLGYAVVHGRSHLISGAVLFVVPFTLVVCAVLRRRAARTVFAQFPDLGPLRLHSYRAIADRRPGVVVTLVSAIIGVASHLLLDAFTHDGRWGASWLGLDARTVAFPIVGPTTPAHLLQDAGHTVGSLIGLLLFLVIGRDRLMERWCGSEVVTRARTFHLAPSARVWFWTIAGLVAAPVAAVARVGGAAPVFSALLGGTLGLLVAGCLPFTAATAPTTEASRRPRATGPPRA